MLEAIGEMLAAVRFGSPLFLLLLPVALIPLIFRGRRAAQPAIPFAPVRFLPKDLRPPRRSPIGWRPSWLRALILTTLVLGLARPQLPYGALPDRADGVDIMFALDFSKSMLARDYTWEGRQATRQEALVGVIGQFVDARPDDRFGIVGFAKFAFLASPLTLDAEWIKAVLSDIDTGVGTAVGDGIMLSTDYLLENPDREKTIVLVSDGLSNRGVAPLEAAVYAGGNGIRIYSIRIMKDALPQSQYQRNVMYRVAEATGGQFFQATNTASLQSIYAQIDQLEAKRIEQRRFTQYQEIYPWILLSGLALLFLEAGLEQLAWRRLP